MQKNLTKSKKMTEIWRFCRYGSIICQRHKMAVIQPNVNILRSSFFAERRVSSPNLQWPLRWCRVRWNWYGQAQVPNWVRKSYIEIKTLKFTKKVQVEPYFEDALCSNCLLKQGPYFCRDLTCFKYYCRFAGSCTTNLSGGTTGAMVLPLTGPSTPFTASHRFFWSDQVKIFGCIGIILHGFQNHVNFL